MVEVVRDNFESTETSKSIRAILRSIGGSKAPQITELLLRRAYIDAVSVECRPDDYSTANEFAVDYLATSLIRKLNCLPTGLDTSKVALASFIEAEEHCKALNHFGRNPFVADGETLSRSFEATIWLAKKKIRRCLGNFSWNEAAQDFGFSSGASTRLKRKTGSPFYKYQAKPEVTRNCALLAVCAIWERPLWRSQMQDTYGLDPTNWVTVVDGSRVTTVPKTSKTDRTICVEPDMNMFIQRGIGACIRRKLRRVGIDLNDQSANQRLAMIGSRTGSLATIDLAAASDSISMMLVETLLPHDWLDAVRRSRCEVTILPDGTKHRLEKVSSMGNGFTFELESLIFWALTASVVELLGVGDTRIGVYGDDIICHHEAAGRLIEVLEYCGFQTNSSKTFVSGPFRESCGKHYFYGQDVTPFFIKEAIDSPYRRYWLINSFRIWMTHRDTVDTRACCLYLIKRLDRKHRKVLVPFNEGLTAGLISDFDEARPRFDKRRQCFRFVALRPRRQKWRPNGVSALLSWFQSNQSHRVSDDIQMLEKGEVKWSFSRAATLWWDNSDVISLAELAR